jgi:ABC-type sugar transport system ATPase subunit
MADIHLNSVSKRFGEVEVIPSLDLRMQDGQCTVLLGPSGCGKSTLLRMIAGLEAPSAGEIRLGGRVMNDVPPAERGCAMVFQNYALYPHKTVRQNLAFPLRMAKVPQQEQQQRVGSIAETLELTPLLDRYPRQLSGGQRQRVAMGRAMIRKPDVFLYDEPLSNLDLELRVRLRLEIARMQRTLRSTAVYVTHDQTEAMTLADTIVVLRKGRIEQVGAPLDLYRQPANVFVAGFIGTPRINLFEVEAGEAGADGTTLRTAGQSIRVPRAFATPVRSFGFRPEHARIGAPGAGEIGIALKGCETQAVEHLGDRAFCYLKCAPGDIVIAAPGDDTQLAGDLQLAVAVEQLHFFDAGEARIEAR